jgi:ribosomal protein S18 acetylase RimI-like enzyme
MTRPNVLIRLITPEEVVPLRHAVLWPSIPIDKQLMEYDTLPTTRHVGAFLRDSPDLRSGSPSTSSLAEDDNAVAPVGILTLTLESYPSAAPVPPPITALNPTRHIQLHKFAVATELQGRGIGRNMYEYVRELLAADDAGVTLLHLDARKSQRGLYEKLGVHVLDDGVRIKRGPGDAGPPVEYIRMGQVVHPRAHAG